MLNQPIYTIPTQEIPLVDSWVPTVEDMVFRHTKDAMLVPVSYFYGVEDYSLNNFYLSPKRSYNNEKQRIHITQYLNYFEKFFDTDRELLSVYCRIKSIIDRYEFYDIQSLKNDISTYILCPSLMYKVSMMNEHNYLLDLEPKKQKESIRYNNYHGNIIMKMSLLMNMCIPIITHYAHMHPQPNVDEFILDIFSLIIDKFDIDLTAKFYETSNTLVETSTKKNRLWDKQDIRAINATTHTISAVYNLIINMMPKYDYKGNFVCLNYGSIRTNIGYQVLEIEYEYDYIQYSSSKRDEDNNSEFDKFESYLTKQDESLFIQNKVNCEHTMKVLSNIYGPFNQDEIEYYASKMVDENGDFVINKFQKELVFYLFYKYFGDSVSINAINRDDYIKLIIMGKRMLESNNMVVLPYILSSKVGRVINRKNVNKKELMKIQSSPYYTSIMAKYDNPKIEKNILSIIAGLLSSEFILIDYRNKDLDGEKIDVFPDFICEEILMFVSLI